MEITDRELLINTRDVLKNILDVCTTKEEGSDGPELLVDTESLYTSVHKVVFLLNSKLTDGD